jgi:hypothetical protein
MQMPFQAKSGARGGRPPTVLLVACTIFGLAAVVAWSSPAAKGNAVLGRFNYWQFWSAVGLMAAAVSVFTIGLLPQKFRRAVGFRLGAIWIGLVFGLLLVELAARFLPVRNQMDNPWYFSAGGGVAESVELPFERPAYLRWAGLSRGDLAQLNDDPDPYARQITFETDWEGFRNGTYIRQADLITIGDSYTEAGNVLEAESFTTLLGKKLNLKTRNLGRAGYSPPVELLVFKKYGLACQPKIVVWQIAESNDLNESLGYQNWLAAGRPPFFDASSDRASLRSKAWKQRSPTYRLFDLLRTHNHRTWPYDGVFHDRAGKEYPVRFLNTPALNSSVVRHEGWDFSAHAIAEGAALCRSNQIQLVVILVPDKYRVLGPYTEMLNRKIRTPPASAGRANPEVLGNMLASLCESLGVPFLDPTASFQQRSEAGELVYLPYDTHLSPFGHEVLADLVADKLKAFHASSTPAAKE